jgi:hypothetical protein
VGSEHSDVFAALRAREAERPRTEIEDNIYVASVVAEAVGAILSGLPRMAQVHLRKLSPAQLLKVALSCAILGQVAPQGALVRSPGEGAHGT